MEEYNHFESDGRGCLLMVVIVNGSRRGGGGGGGGGRGWSAVEGWVKTNTVPDRMNWTLCRLTTPLVVR